MRKPRIQTTVALPMLPPLPGWIMSGPAETFEAAAFRSGAALAHLTFATTAADLPQALWRDRLALVAAEFCAGIAGRRAFPVRRGRHHPAAKRLCTRSGHT